MTGTCKLLVALFWVSGRVALRGEAAFFSSSKKRLLRGSSLSGTPARRREAAHPGSQAVLPALSCFIPRLSLPQAVPSCSLVLSPSFCAGLAPPSCTALSASNQADTVTGRWGLTCTSSQLITVSLRPYLGALAGELGRLELCPNTPKL